MPCSGQRQGHTQSSLSDGSTTHGHRRSTVIRVSITYGDLMVEADFESDFYSGDVVEDMTTRTCSALLATLQHLWAMQP